MPLKKNTSLSDKNSEILTIFRAHFGGYMHLARIRLVCHIITALCKVRSVNYSKLSSGFATGATGDSNYRRIQRFMALANLPMEWLSKLIFASCWAFKRKVMRAMKSSGQHPITGTVEVDETVFRGQEEGVRGRKNRP